MNRAVDRIMQGVKTPEGKIIAILLAVCLSLMTWNISAISFAVNRDDGVEEVTTKVEEYDYEDNEGVEGVVEEVVADEAATAQEEIASEQEAVPEATETPESEATESETPEATEAAESGESASKESADKEDEKETKFPAQHFDSGVGGLAVSVDAPEGALPEGSRMYVSSVPAARVINQVEGLVDGEVNDVMAVDITFRDAEGNEVEPKESLRVTFSNPAIAEATVDDEQDVAVVHIDDSGAAELVSQDAAPASDEVAITTDEFSVYVIVTTNVEGEIETGVAGDERLEVVFHNIDGSTTSALVKKPDVENELLETLIVEPEIGDLGNESAVFLGWTTDADYTPESAASAMNMAQVYAYITNLLNEGVHEGDVLDLYPVVVLPFYVTYLDELGAIIQTDTVLYALDGDENSAPYTVNALYTAKEPTENFEGWNVQQGAENISLGDVTYANGDNVTLTGDVTFEPYVPTGSWLIFKENGKGATYTSAAFIKTNEVTVQPADPTRFGYTFGGWYTDADCADGTEFEFGNTLDAKTTLYAKWVPVADANYTVIIWKQNVEGTGYDFAEAITLSGPVGQEVSTIAANGEDDGAYATVDGAAKQYTGFHLSSYDENVEIMAEGTSVVNVYYNRNVVTLYFYTYTTKESGDYVIASGNLASGTYYIKNPDGTFTETYLYYSEGYWYLTAEDEQVYVAYSTAKDGTYYVKNADGTYSEQYLYYNDADGRLYKNKEGSYTYSKSNSTSEGYYYLPTGDGGYEYTYLYYNNKKWYKTRSNSWYGYSYSDRYQGDRYVRSGTVDYSEPATPYKLTTKTTYSDQYTGDVYTKLTTSSTDWHVLYTLTGLYGSTIADGGQAWPTEFDWYATGGTGGSASGTRTTFLDAFMLSDGSSSESFYGKAPSGTKDIVFYKQNADGSGYTEANRVSAAANASFYISDKYNGFTAYQYSVDGGQWKDVGAKSGGYYNNGNSVSYSNTLEIRFNRNDFSINYMDGVYVDGNGTALDSYTPRGQLSSVSGITYGADVSSYAKGGANYYEPEYDGFVFEGWYADEACTQPYTFTTLPEGGVTVYAKWRQVQYRVFMHPNVPTTDTSLEWGEGQEMSFRIADGGTISPITGIRDGYELVGWYFDPSFTQPFDFDAVELNSTTVTGAYDKTEPTEYDDYGNPTSSVNKDATADRFWISNKLDLYAKWRSTIVGAKGITVQYVDANGEVISTDSHLYADQATAFAEAAPNLGEDNTFICWSVQTWDEEADEFVDTNETVYPGGTFTVAKDYTRQIENEGATVDDDPYIYLLRLRAVSAASESAGTFILYDANGGDFAEGVEPRTDFTTNTTQTLLGEGSAERAGYTLAGWSLSAGDDNSVDFPLGETVSADNSDRSDAAEGNTEDNTLYAVWVPAVTITSVDRTYTYSGSAQGPETSYVVTSEIEGFAPVTLSAGANTLTVGGKTFTVTITPDAEATVTNVGDTAQNGFEAAVTRGGASADDQIGVTTGYGTLSVEPMAVVVTASDVVKTYGDADPDFTAVVVPAVEGLSYTVERTEAGEDVGTYAIAPSGEAVQGNYTVTYAPSTLTIAPAPLTITVNAQNYVYNGSAQGETGASYTGSDIAAKVSVGEGQLKRGDVLSGITLTGSETAVGEYAGAIEASGAVVNTGAGADAIANYTIEYVAGNLSITQSSAMALTAVGNEKVYDGEPLFAGFAVDVPDSSDATITYRYVTGTDESGAAAWSDWSDEVPARTDVGSTSFEVRAENANYETQTATGVLKVTPLTVTVSVVGANNSTAYDGELHAASGYTATATSELYNVDDYLVFNGAAEASRVVAGTSYMGLAAEQFSNSNSNFDVELAIADGYQAITPVATEVVVTIAGANSTLPFDGNAHSTTGYTVTDVSNDLYAATDVALVEGASASAERTDAGTTNMGLTPASFVNTNANFDNVTFVVTDGFQTIEPVAVTVTIVGNTATAAYDGEPHTAADYTATASTPLYDVDDVEFSGEASVARTDAGTTNMGLTAEQFANTNDNFSVTFAITDGYVTVEPIDATVTVIGNSDTADYDGQAHEVSGFTTRASTELYDASGIVFTGTAEVSRTNAGTTYMGLASEQFVNTDPNFDNVTFNVTDGSVTVKPIDVTVTVVGNTVDAPYDNSAHVASGYVATASSELYDVDTDFTFSGTAEATQTNAGTANMGLAADQFANTNANFGTVTFEVTDGHATVSPIDATVYITGNTDAAVYDGTAHSVAGYTATASTSLYDVNSDFTFEGEATAIRTDMGTTEMGLAAEQFTNTNANFGTVTFEVTDGFMQIDAVDEVTVFITGHTGVADYNGSQHGAVGYDVSISNPLYTLDDFTFSGEAVVARADAGTSYMGLAPEQFANTNANFDNVTFVVTDGYQTINPIAATVTITGHNTTADYNGAAHGASGYDVQTSTLLYTNLDFTFEGDASATRTNAGTTYMGLASSQFTNTNPNFSTVTFEVVDGYVTVNPIDAVVNIVGANNKADYDGVAHSASGYTATTENTLYDVDNDFEFAGTAGISRVDAGTAYMNLTSGQFANTNPNFGTVTFNVTDGFVTVKPIATTVRIVGVGNTVSYDGLPHTVTGYTATATSELYNVDADIAFDGSAIATQTDAGITTMGLVPAQFANTNPNFASVTFEVTDGYQKVSKIDAVVTIVGDHDTVTFDGTEHGVSGYTATASTPLYDVDADFTFNGTAEAARTDAGTTAMGLVSDQFVNENPNFAHVTFNVTDGYQAIEKRAVTVSVTGNNSAADYDGTAHTASGYAASANYELYDTSNVSLVNGNVATATRTNAGTTNMGLTPSMFQNADSNYNVTFAISADGYQAVNQVNATVTIVGAHNTATYDGDEHGVSGYTATASTPLYDVTRDFTFTGEAEAARADVGTTNMGLAADQFTNDNANFGTVTFEVTDGYQTIAALDTVVVTITGHTSAVDYDGTAHAVSGYDVQISDPLYTQDDFTFTGTAEASQTDAGTAYMGLAPEQFENTNGNFSDVTFVVTDGYQKVDPINASVNIKGETVTATYDGSEHSVSGYDVEIANDLYTQDDFTFTGAAEAARTDAGTTNMGLTSAQFVNENPNFATVIFNVTDGYVTIDKANAAVTITGHNDTTDFDGAAHTVSGYDVAIDGALYTEADFTFTGSAAATRTDAGTTNMGLDAAQFANVNANFAKVTFTVVDGYQTIEPIDATVTIEGENSTLEYDGSAHSVSGYTATADTELYDVTADFMFSGIATASRTDAGTTEMGLVAEQFANVNDNFRAVTFKVTDGYQAIEPIDAIVHIVGAANTTTYDGFDHTVTGYVATASTPLYDVTRDFAFTGAATATQNAAGTANMGLTAEQFANTNANFANVTFEVTDGYQAITEIPSTTVYITGESTTVDYDGTSHAVSGYTAKADNALYNVNADIAFAGTAEAERTDAGTTNMGLTSAQFTNTNANFGTVDFVVTDGFVTVTPISATVTVVGDNATVDYDGHAHGANGYEAAASTTLYRVNEDMAFNGSAAVTRTNAGTTAMGLASGQFTNTNPNFTNVVFDVTDGYVTVKPIDATVTVVGNNDSVAYDSIEHSVSGYVATASTPLYDVTRDFTFTGSAAAKRANAGTSTMGLAAAQFANTNENFRTVTFEITDGYQTVQPIDATVTIVGHNSTNTYDGTTYTVAGYDVSFSTSLYDASMFTFTPAEDAQFVGSDIAASRSVEGTTYMGLAADQFANASANFATVTFEVTDGYQAITANDTAVVRIEGNSATVTYNGLEQEATGYTVAGITVNGKDAGDLYTEDDFTFSGEARAAGVDATNGTPYVMGLAADQFTNMNGNFTDVEFVVTDGTLVIERAPLVVVTDSASKPYDGTPLTQANVVIEGLVNGETATAEATGSIIGFGSTPNTRGEIEWGTASEDNYTVSERLGTLEITTNPVEITLTAASDSKTYDGTPLENADVAVEGLPADGGLYVEAEATGSATHVNDAGVNAVSSFAVYDADGNDVTANFTNIAAMNGKLTISPAPLTVVTASASKPYDGTPIADASTSFVGLQNDETASAVATGSITDPGAAPNTRGAITWISAAPSDYTVTDQLGTLEVLTNSTLIMLRAPSGTKVYDGTELTAAQAGAVTATGLPTTANFQIVATASGNVVNVVPFAGEEPTTTVDDGYAIMLDGKDVTEFFPNRETATGTLSITPATLEVTAEGYSGVYDGQVHGPASIATSALNDEAVTNAVEYMYSWTDEDGVEQTSATEPTITNAGSVTYTVTASSSNYQDASAQFTLSVAKRPVTLTSGSAEAEYNGNALVNDEVVVGGSEFVEGEGATYDVTGSQTLVGSSKNTFTYTLNAGTLAENYDITLVEGTLNVMNRDALYTITLVANSGEFVYDGASHEVSGFESLEFEVEGNTYTVDATSVTATSGERANVLYEATRGADEVGEQAVSAWPVTITGTPVVRDAAGNDVSDQFAVSMQAGELAISPRTVQLTSADINKVYDATPLVNGDVALAVEDGWVAGEGATYAFTGSQMLVGASDNAFTFTLNAGTLAGNYDITTAFGVLTVTDGTGEDDTTVVDDSLVITKTDSAANDGRTYALGDTITWVISVTNIYDEEKTLEVTEAEGITLGEVPTTLAAGETVEIEATHVVDEADLLAGGFVNTAVVTLGDLQKQASDKVEFEAVNPHLTVTKTATEDPEGGFALGQQIDYTITVVNDGNVTVSDIMVLDPLTGDTWTIESLAPGAEPAEFTASYTVTSSDILKGSIVNMATATGTSPEPGVYDVEVQPGTVTSVTEPINNAMSVEKRVVNAQDAFEIGDTIRYEIVVTNDGNTELHDIVVSDDMDAAGTAVLGSGDGVAVQTDGTAIISRLAAGESATISAIYQVVEEDAGAQLSNAATATAPGSSNPTNPMSDDPNDNPDIPASDVTDGEQTFYKLTIHYYYDGTTTQVADDFRGYYAAGASVVDAVDGAEGIASPAVGGLTASSSRVYVRVAEGGAFGMPAANSEYTVYYSPVVAPEVEPGEDGSSSSAGAPAASAAVAGEPGPPVAISVDADGNVKAEVIQSDDIALSGAEGPEAAESGWALFNLLATIAAALLTIIMLVGAFGRRREDDGETTKKHRSLRIASIVPTVIAVVLLLLFQDFSKPMVMFDVWSVLFAVIAIVNIALLVLSRKKADDSDDDTPQQASLVAADA